MKREEAVLDTILTIAYEMLRAGLEVRTVETVIERLCTTYEMEEVQVFTITSSILVSAKCKDGSIYTQSKRIYDYCTNFAYLEELDALVERVETEKIEGEELAAAVAELKQRYQKEQGIHAVLWQYFLYCFISFCFSLFFGGSLLDGCAACVCAIVIRSVIYAFDTTGGNKFLSSMIASAAGGLVAWMLYQGGLSDSIDKVIIGNIMLLIPGLATVNAFRDLIGGDIISGLLRLADALIVAAAVAIGFAFVFFVV